MIPVGRPDITDLEIGYVTRAVVTNQLSKGEHQKEFEDRLCDWTGHDYAVGVSSGTAAIHLALTAMGVKPLDEVIVPSLTFAAVAAAVVHAGADPVFVGCDENSCMDPAAVARAMTNKTSAVIAVHSYGNRAKVDQIASAAPGAKVLIDASQGHGLRTHGGYTEILSFHGNKVCTSAEGGAIVTDDEDIAKECRYLSTHGQDSLKSFWHSAVGYNYKLTNLQAALGCAQLRRADDLLKRRHLACEMYKREGLDLFPYSVPWLASVMVHDRDKVAKQLEAHDIEFRAWFPLIHTMPPYRRCRYHADQYGHADYFTNHGINLPTFGGITLDEVKQVVKAVKCAS